MRIKQNNWTLILASHELKQKPLGIERFGIHWVLWRDNQENPVMFKDWCPHLGAKLSPGKVCQGRIQCPFHGLEFDSLGQCTHIPAHGKDKNIPKGFELEGNLPLKEENGFIWAWTGPVLEKYPDTPFFKELTFMQSTGLCQEWNSHYTRSIENQLDVAHLPFVHQSTIGAGGRTLVQGPLTRVSEERIQVWVFNEKDLGQIHKSHEELESLAKNSISMLEFRFPNIWVNRISPKMAIFVGFVPINPHTTRLYLYVYQNMVKVPVIRGIFHFLLNQFNKVIINQDQSVVSTQRPKQTSLETPEKFISSDSPIIQFRKLRAKLLDQKTGLPLNSPILQHHRLE